MTDHIDTTELALFVLGQLDGARRAHFEAHAARCEACAAQLAREARLELALRELGERGALVAAEPTPEPRATPERQVRRRRARSLIAAAVVAAAAAAVLVAWPRGRVAETGAASSPSPVCAAGPDQLACVQRAHRHGLFVRYPTWAGPPPLGGVDPGRRAPPETVSAARGPSAPPFTTFQAEL